MIKEIVPAAIAALVSQRGLAPATALPNASAVSPMLSTTSFTKNYASLRSHSVKVISRPPPATVFASTASRATTAPKVAGMHESAAAPAQPHTAAVGHGVTEAASGRKALEQLRARRFDLLVTDRAMPELSGKSLTVSTLRQARVSLTTPREHQQARITGPSNRLTGPSPASTLAWDRSDGRAHGATASRGRADRHPPSRHLTRRRRAMINEPQIPSFERPRGQRGDTTQTYVREAQDRADLGASPAKSSETSPGAAGGQGGGGVMAFLGRFWPFKRNG